jgi:hypothetical protein
VSDVTSFPNRELLAEAAREREITNSPEAEALRERVFEAVQAYGDFLDNKGLFFDDADYPRVKASTLVVTLAPYIGIDIRLRDGASDRVYGRGSNPDPDGRGPPDYQGRKPVRNKTILDQYCE